MMMGGPGWWSGGWWMMPLFWILVIAGIVMVVKSLIDRPAHASHASHVEKTPLQILDERYARGEISEQEFEHIREHLSK